MDAGKIAGALSERIEQLGLTYEELAQRAGVSVDEVHLVLAGDPRATLGGLLAVCAAIGFVVVSVPKPAAPAIEAGWEATEPVIETRVARVVKMVRARHYAPDLLERAAGLMGNRQEAERWLLQPAMGLSSRRPVDLLDTEEGRREVDEFLARLDAGTYT